MSGYRSLHREQVLHDEGGVAIWSCQATPLLVSSSSSSEPDGEQRWRIWTASSDGYVRAYTAQPTSMADDSLNASALSLHCSHVLIGTKQQQAPSPAAAVDGGAEQRPAAALGCSVVHTIRNYSGEDQDSGDYVVASLEMAGTVRIWSFTADWDEKQQPAAATGEDADSAAAAPPKPVKCLAEFTVENATGTTLQLAPPRTITSVQEVVVAVGCLDGTVAIVATGIRTTNAAAAATTNKKEPSTAGTVLDTWGSPGSATPLSLSWHPTQTETLVVGRQDGVVDLLSSIKKNQHRLLQLSHSPCRAVSVTPDGNLLVAGNDAGMLCVWDIHRAHPVLVHHVLQAHKSWILDLCCLSDSRRLVTVGAERQIHVWSVGQLAQNQPLHTFQLDGSVWTAHVLQSSSSRSSGKQERAPRLVTGSDTGWLQVFSLES